MRSLVVDDEMVAVDKLISLLAPLGSAEPATRGQQALELFRKALEEGCPYDLVTIDIEMPDMNGIMLLSRLRWEEQTRHGAPAKKIMVTAHSTTSRVIAAATGKCDAYLVKPVQRDVLLDKLARLGMLPAEPAQAATSPAGAPQDVANAQPPARTH
jgi:two-component system, chemotaxis family, chemotaxis protein CheY